MKNMLSEVLLVATIIFVVAMVFAPFGGLI
jgi:hypothetical protein